MRTFILLVVPALWTLVSGQLSLTGLPTCAQGCVANYTSGDNIGDCGALDIACICSSKNFISGISCCLYSNCNKADQQTSITFAHQICGTAGVQVPNEVVCANATSATGTTGTTGTTGSTGTVSANATAVSTGTRSTATANATATGAGAKATGINSGPSNAISELGLTAGIGAAFLAFFFL